MTPTRHFNGFLFVLLVTVGCTIQVTPKAKAQAEGGTGGGAIVCCRTEPEAGPEGCLCEPVSTAIITVTGTSCSTSTTVNGEAVDFTGYVVSSCP